jgi:adenylate cyclase
MARDSYEVYYFQNNRWSVHASFEGDARDEAIEEAINVETKLGFPARVVRETYYAETNTTEEVVAWQGAKSRKIADSDNMFGNRPAAPAKPGQKKPAPPPQIKKPAPDKKPDRPKDRPIKKPISGGGKKKRKEKGVFGKILTSIGVSMASAIAAGVATTMAVLTAMSQGLMEQTDQTPIIIGAVVSVFFITLLVSLNNQFSLLGTALKSSAPSSTARRPAAGALQSPMMRAAASAPATQDVEFDQVEIERGQVAEEAIPDAPSLDDNEPPPDLGDDMSATQETVSAQPEPEPEPQPQSVVVAQPQAAPQQAVEQRPEPKPEKKAPPQTNNEAEARKIFSDFVAAANNTVARNVGELNTISRFGLSLVLAGAISALGKAKTLAREPQLAVLKQGLSAIGNTTDRTQTFCAELPGYGKNARYTGMIQGGSKAMTAFMNGDANATAALADMLADWSKPEKRAATPSIFTFLFTDIAGSTAMTQQLGNAGAQKVVRAHNTAVRNAIAKVSGREVKHTGDGIMAVFKDSPSAVSASIQMQRDIAAHNAANPALPLVVRIGINAGEAVEEENDFFGAAVQMTARVCSKASDGNIWVSQSIVDACKGQRLGFIPRGKFEMKGIQGAKTLYEVGWTEKHKNELADL